MEEELRARLTEVELVVEEERRGRNEANDALVELVAKREELEATLAWERLEWKNRADGLEARLDEKEETIGKLKEELVVQVKNLHVTIFVCFFSLGLVTLSEPSPSLL